MPVADEALARDRERVLRQARDDGVAEVERRREVLDLPGREQERADAVDPQLEPGEEARVLGEEPAREAVEVADLVADAEGRSLEDRQPPSTPSSAHDAGAARLGERLHHDLVDVHVRRPRQREQDAVGDLVRA